MPLLDATLAGRDFAGALLFYADFADLPLRGGFAHGPVHVPTGLPDSDGDCAGITFPVADSEVLEISPVSHEDGGTDTMTFTMFADPANTALMAAIETPALYVGRTVRLWLGIIDVSGVPVAGGVPVTELRPLYRGYMTQPAQQVDDGQFIITMAAENWRSILSGAQSRTYVQSTLYDPGDFSGAVIKAGGRAPYIEAPGAPGPGSGGEGYNAPWLEFQR